MSIRLRVLSWNIQDGGLDTVDALFLRHAIAAWSPDVVLVLEYNLKAKSPLQPNAEIDRVLGSQGFGPPWRSELSSNFKTPPTVRGAAAYVKPSQWIIAPLHDPVPSYSGFSLARLSAPGGAVSWILAPVLNHKKKGNFDRLLAMVQTLAAHPFKDIPVLSVGDFNHTPNTWRDSRLSKYKAGFELPPSPSLSPADASAPWGNVATHAGKRRIDFAISHPRARFSLSAVHHLQNTPGSDHLAIVVEALLAD